MIRASLLRALGGIVAITLSGVTLTACTPAFKESIDVQAGQDAVFTVNDDFEIRIPGASIGGSGKLNVESVEQEGTSGWSIEMTDGASLIGEAELHFGYELSGDEPAPIALYNSVVGEPLLLGGVGEEAADGQFVVRTAHFSNWFLAGWGDFLGRVGDLLKRTFSTPGANVECQGTDRAQAAGYSASRSGSDAYKWCMGMEGEQAYIRVGNPNGYPVRVEATPNMVLTNPDETLTSLLPRAFSAVTDLPERQGNTVYLLGGGDSYTFNVTSTAPQGLRVRPSGTGYIASALLYGIETVQMLAKGGKYDDIVKAMEAVQCGVGGFAMANDDVGDADEAATYMTGAFNTVFACLGRVIEAQWKTEGPLAVGVATGIAWFLSGVKAVFDGIAGGAETLLHQEGSTVVVENSNSDVWIADSGGVGPIRMGMPLADALAALDNSGEFAPGRCGDGYGPDGEYVAMVAEGGGVILLVVEGREPGVSRIVFPEFGITLDGPSAPLDSTPGVQRIGDAATGYIWTATLDGVELQFTGMNGLVEQIAVGGSGFFECNG